MKNTMFFAATVLFANLAFAQAPAVSPSAKPGTPPASQASASNCEAKAVGKNGKPLTGAAKTAFMKRCTEGSAESVAGSCETKAVDKNGKPLAGAAKSAFIKKCVADAGK